MTRKTFDYICSLVKVPSLEDMNSYTFIDGRVLYLEDRVAVALRRLYSSESSETLGSAVGVSKSMVMLVTERFVAALCEQAIHYVCQPYSSEMDNIKSMFAKMYNMDNCCGVICATYIPFEANCDHEKNGSVLMQVSVDAQMRFRNIICRSAGSMNRLSLLHNLDLFHNCEKGEWLNGSKLKVASDGSEVGEYMIGEAGYPLLPWLLTPYQEEELSDFKAEFNRRHEAATTFALKALARFQDTWKYLQRETVNSDIVEDIIDACCILHNIVTEMEDDGVMPSAEEGYYREEVRQIANEDAIRARDMLSRYFLTTKSFESGVAVDAEDHEAISSGSGYEGKEQEVQTRTTGEERQC